MTARSLFYLALLFPLLASGDAAQSDFNAQIQSLVQTNPVIQRAHFGFKVVDLQTGQTLAQQNPAEFFTPASNVKLYTTAFALSRLGPDYRFQTALQTTGGWHPGQTSVPNLLIAGAGDPDLSGRVMPYAVDSHAGDPLAGIRDLVAKLGTAGIQEVNGDITGVATRYAGDRYPDGWTVDDTTYGYGAAVSSLAVNDNVITVCVHPGKRGELASLEMNPSLDHFVLLNEVTTDDSDRSQINITRPPGSNEVILAGTIGVHAPEWQNDFGVTDPALFAAESAIEVLRENGIAVRGTAAALYCSGGEQDANCAGSPPTVLATHLSPPMSQVVQVVNKVSQNLHAEMLLREAGYVTSGSNGIKPALEAREDFLKTIGVVPDGSGFAFADGSGLARQDLTTPDSTVVLLQAMWQGGLREVWLASLPIGGVDGSLQHRFHNMVGADHVHAKTGSISHVSTLSGYLETQHHGWLAFSIMVNDAVGHDADVRQFLDSFCGLFLGY